MMERIYIFKYW